MRRDPSERLLDELRRAVDDERVLDALASVPRDAFVPPEVRDRAWSNEPLPIGGGQTISQPLVVAHMCAVLELSGEERVLDIGTGSGWHAAILARLARHVWSIERDPVLSRAAGRHLRHARIDNVTLLVGDGSKGVPESAPFDVINAAAAGDESALDRLEPQLADGGRLVAPILLDPLDAHQQLVLSTRHGDRIDRRVLGPVSFVPLVRG
jgi:protein-L-isoaspartate(D-aspartate) O-methyltransferase